MEPLDAWPDVPDGVRWTVYAIYCHPIDFPNHWVVRRWFVMRTGGLVVDVIPRVADTLADARRHVPPTHTKDIAVSNDDPFLHEALAMPGFPPA